MSKGETPEGHGYRILTEDLGRLPYPEEHEIIAAIRDRFSGNDFLLAFEGTRLVLYLKAMQFEDFKAEIREQEGRTGLPDRYAALGEADIFARLVEQVEKVGSYGFAGGKRVFIGFNRERKVKDRAKKTSRRGSYYYAAGHAFSKEENDIPEEYQNRIICGDSEEVLRRLPANCVDIVFTSPPYNFGLGYENSEDGIDWNEYFKKLFAIFSETIRVLKFGGRIIVNIQPLFSDYIPIHHIVSDFFMRNHLIWKGEILWEKNNYNCKYTAWGSWKSPSSPYLKYTWEYLEIYCKGDLAKSGRKKDIDIDEDEFKRWVVARWPIAPERNMKRYNHPAMFPEELAERVLKLFSYKNDIVLDPFNGVGTTTAVAKRTGRKYLGIDISEEYCRTAEARLKGSSDSL